MKNKKVLLIARFCKQTAENQSGHMFHLLQSDLFFFQISFQGLLGQCQRSCGTTQKAMEIQFLL